MFLELEDHVAEACDCKTQIPFPAPPSLPLGVFQRYYLFWEGKNHLRFSLLLEVQTAYV